MPVVWQQLLLTRTPVDQLQTVVLYLQGRDNVVLQLVHCHVGFVHLGLDIAPLLDRRSIFRFVWYNVAWVVYFGRLDSMVCINAYNKFVSAGRVVVDYIVQHFEELRLLLFVEGQAGLEV